VVAIRLQLDIRVATGLHSIDRWLESRTSLRHDDRYQKDERHPAAMSVTYILELHS
jgi:hypothetical protein